MKDHSPGTKRTKKRIKARLDVMCRQMTEGKNLEFKCASVDVSELGIQILTGHSLDAAQSLYLEIRLPHPENTSITAMGRIRWRKEEGPGKNGAPEYAYGISFDEIAPKSLETLFSYIYTIGESESARDGER